MAEVNITPINNGDNGDANLWNSRFAAITAQINGNIDQSNLADGAVTTPKIPNEAITASKLYPRHELWAHYSSASGQVFGTGVGVPVFDVVRQSNGIVYSTSTGIATIQRSGWYDLTASYRCIDVSTVYQPIVQLTRPSTSTWVTTLSGGRSTVQDESTTSVSGSLYIEEGQQVRTIVIVDANTRAGASSADELPWHSFLQITEMR